MRKCINLDGTIKDREGFRFTSRQNTQGNRALMHMWWNELNNLYGMGVHYYVHGYSFDSHDYLYGEDTTAVFAGPTPMLLLGTMDSDSMLLTKWGIQTNSDFTAIIPRNVYAEHFGRTAEPKSGDLIRLEEWGCDRPGACGDPYYNGDTPYPISQDLVCESIFTNNTQINDETIVTPPSGFGCSGPYCNRMNWGKIIRCPYLFEVTERRDEMVTQSGYNTFMGHYVWILHCKRFDFSYDPGVAGECGNQQVSDEKNIGIQPGGSQPVTPPKKYEDNVEDESDDIWDYGYPGNNTDVYGGYKDRG